MVFTVESLGVDRSAQRVGEDLNEEQTATLETALLHAALMPMIVRAQMRTARQGSNPLTWHPTHRVTKG